MSKIEEAQEILKELGLPKKQQNKMSALTLLALCNLKEEDSWGEAENIRVGISTANKIASEGIMDFIAEHYNEKYAENSRESFRRQVIHQLVQAGVVIMNPDAPNLPTNSPNYHYALSPEALEVIKTYNTEEWENKVNDFIEKKGALKEKYENRREKQKIPVKFPNGEEFKLSPGKHNEVQKAVIDEFAPMFAPGSEVLYLSDTAEKDFFIAEDRLEEIGANITTHDKLPDIILYEEDKDWIYFIEAVTSHGPMSQKRVIQLDKMFSDCSAGKIYVTAFPDFKQFKSNLDDIAWETEVWIKERPTHMIHYNGDRFYGPRK